MRGRAVKGLAFKIAKRELRGGIKGFRVFLICLALGVAAIAAIGTLRGAIQGALSDQGTTILGGDAEMKFTYRYASEAERAFMAAHSERISEVIDFRSMLQIPDDQALTQVKAVDDHWPLYGLAEISPAMPLAQAFAGEDGLPGAILDPILMARLGLQIGDSFRLGRQDFRLMATLISEPDSVEGGFGLGPRSLVHKKDLGDSGLLNQGSMFDVKYRMALPEGKNLAALKAEAEEAFGEEGMRWRDSRNAAPGITRFVDNIASFLVLVGLAGLAVGGIGISAAVRAWLEGKTATIATLKTLGASSGLIFRVFLLQVSCLAAIGIAAGLIIGALVPWLAAPLIQGSIPFAITIAPSKAAMFEAAFYGLMVTLIFTLLPLARAEATKPAILYRGIDAAFWPRKRWLFSLALLVVITLAVVILTSGLPLLALGTAGGILAALGVLALAAGLIKHLAAKLARSRICRNRPILRSSLAAIGGPRSDTLPVILSLGLGLSVLASVGQIDSNIRKAIERDLPDRAPAFFFVDIQPDQIGPFREMMAQNPAVSRLESAPMLRGVITKINDRPARDVAGNHWVVRGDRGLTYAAQPPAGTTLTAGQWWPEDYTGAPQVSFGQDEADEIGLALGDQITVNVLGRELTATITSFRDVDFTNGGMNFVMVLNQAALAGAPHSNIATVYAPPEAEAAILRTTSKTWPNITAIGVRDAVDQASKALSAIASATAWAAAGTLFTGFAVLIGAAAAGERARAYEAAILKVLGASRARILTSFSLRAAILGAAAGLVAVCTGAASAWAVMRFVMDVPFRFEPVSASAIILSGIAATLIAGLLYARGPLAAKPASILRAKD